MISRVEAMLVTGTLLGVACASAERAPVERTTARATLDTSTEPDVDALGSDVSSLPRRYPQGSWLPMEGHLFSLELLAKVEVNGRAATAIIDTGATPTVVSIPMARHLGLLAKGERPTGTPIQATDAHGAILQGVRMQVDELKIGNFRFRDVPVIVLGEKSRLLLVGNNLLQHLDLFVAADEGMLGVFAPGTAPTDGARSFGLNRSGLKLTVLGTAPSARGDNVRFELIVDSGASLTAVPARVGIAGGLPADTSFIGHTVAVGGVQENRGRFALRPLRLGPEQIGVDRVWAYAGTMEGGKTRGLLGNDVLFRHHTIISFTRARAWFAPVMLRPPSRTRGPGGAVCTDDGGQRVPCLRVSLEHTDEDPELLCLRVVAHARFGHRTLELAVTAHDRAGVSLLGGGAIHVFLSVGGDGENVCFPLWSELARLGVRDDTRLSLTWVRAEGLEWPCDPMATRCISLNGTVDKYPSPPLVD